MNSIHGRIRNVYGIKHVHISPNVDNKMNLLNLISSADASPWYTVSLAMFGKFQIAASFAVIYVYAGELMPTVVRSEAMGISSFFAGIGLLIFPYINNLVRMMTKVSESNGFVYFTHSCFTLSRFVYEYSTSDENNARVPKLGFGKGKFLLAS
jgi:hypothetical protein